MKVIGSSFSPQIHGTAGVNICVVGALSEARSTATTLGTKKTIGTRGLVDASRCFIG